MTILKLVVRICELISGIREVIMICLCTECNPNEHDLCSDSDRLWCYKKIYDYMCSPESSLLRDPSLRPLLRPCSDLHSDWISLRAPPAAKNLQRVTLSPSRFYDTFWPCCWSGNYAQSLKSSCAITQVKPWNPAWRKFEFILLLYIVYLFTTISRAIQQRTG